MTKFADYFATVFGGKIAALNWAHPAHELTQNQIMLTKQEYDLLCAVKTIEEAKQLIGSVEYKISQLEKTDAPNLQP